MRIFNPIDLSLVPPPDIIEQLDFEARYESLTDADRPHRRPLRASAELSQTRCVACCKYSPTAKCCWSARSTTPPGPTC